MGIDPVAAVGVLESHLTRSATSARRDDATLTNYPVIQAGRLTALNAATMATALLAFTVTISFTTLQASQLTDHKIIERTQGCGMSGS